MVNPSAVCKAIVGILSLPNRADCEEEPGDYIPEKMAGNRVPSLHEHFTTTTLVQEVQQARADLRLELAITPEIRKEEQKAKRCK